MIGFFGKRKKEISEFAELVIASAVKCACNYLDTQRSDGPPFGGSRWNFRAQDSQNCPV